MARDRQRGREKQKDPGRSLSRAVSIFYISAFCLLFLRDFQWQALALAVAVPLAGAFTTGFLPRLFPVDKLLLSLTNFLCALGLLVLYDTNPTYAYHQSIYYFVGLAAMVVCIYLIRVGRSFRLLVWPMMLLSLVLQLGTSLIGELPVPNNDAVTGLARTDYKRMIAVAVLMAPLVEECLFRGVVFGTIRPKSRFWAYAASIALFSLYHVWQYVLVYQDPKLLLSALAYVPVSAALTFCYEQTRSIWSPVFFHMCINALSLTVLAG